jgi:hypothetical protein
LYVIIGDLNHRGIFQNLDSRDKPDDTGVILKINAEDGSAIETNPFSSDPNTAKYFAYGIRNFLASQLILSEIQSGKLKMDLANMMKLILLSQVSIIYGFRLWDLSLNPKQP